MRIPKIGVAFGMALLMICLPVFAEELRGTVKSVDGDKSCMVVHDELGQRDVVVNFDKRTTLKLSEDGAAKFVDLKPGAHVTVSDTVIASRVAIEGGAALAEKGESRSMAAEFWYNFRHNLFKPLLLFFYLGFLVPILRVHFEFPYVMYQALTIYLLIAIGWHGGEELSHLGHQNILGIVGFMAVGFLTNAVVGLLAYGILRVVTQMRRIDQATVAGYYGPTRLAPLSPRWVFWLRRISLTTPTCRSCWR